MATAVLKSKVTKRSQTTLPRAVENALHFSAGDELGYVIRCVRYVRKTAMAAAV